MSQNVCREWEDEMTRFQRSTIYCLPGRGGRLNAGLGLELQSRGYHLMGRETVGDFARLSFSDQTALIADDLVTAFWEEDARIIANSFGCFLFLHAQSLLAPFPGEVLLLSPVVGSISSAETGICFSPPRGDLLLELAAAGCLTVPKSCEIHVGELDRQCPPDLVSRFGEATGIPVTVIPENGHMLSKSYVSRLLDEWLSEGT